MDYQIVLPVEENGRLIVTVHSPNPNAIWALNVEKYSTQGIIQVTDIENISGIGSSSFAVTSGGDESLVVTDSFSNDGTQVDFRYRYV